MPSKPAAENSFQNPTGRKHLGMLACCVVMLAPLAYLSFSGSALALNSASFSTMAPIVICIGLHVVVHKFMGRNCRGSTKQCEPKNTGTVKTELHGAKCAQQCDY